MNLSLDAMILRLHGTFDTTGGVFGLTLTIQVYLYGTFSFLQIIHYC